MTTTEETMMTEKQKIKIAIDAANFVTAASIGLPISSSAYADRWASTYEAVMRALEDR